MRIDIRRIAQIKKGEDSVGNRVKSKVVENKVAPPFRVAEFDIMNDGGISKTGGLVDVGVELGIIEKSGAFYRFSGTMLGQGKPAAIMFLEEKENKKLKEDLEKQIRAKAASGKKPPVVIVGDEEAN